MTTITTGQRQQLEQQGNSETVFIVEVETGSCDEGNAMLFDSVWDSLELAQEYCEKFKTVGYLDQGWDYEITEVVLNSGG